MIKKFFFLAVFFFTSPAFAQGEGLYLGFDGIATRSSYHHQSILTGQTDYRNVGRSSSHISYAAGLHAKYVANFDQFFVAPGVIIEQNSFGGSANRNTYLDRLQVRNRYGVKLDYGYNIGWIAPYLTIGYAAVDYKTRTDGYAADGSLVSAVKKGRASTPFYGVGMKFSVTPQINVLLEYNYQRFYAETKVPTQATDYIRSIRFNTHLDVIKLGLSYKF